MDIKVSMNVDFVFNYLLILFFFYFIFIVIAGSEGLILWVHFVADGMSFRNPHKGDNL